MATIFFTLYFDTPLESAIRRLWDVLARCGAEGVHIQDHRPHITLAAYEVEEVESYEQRLASFVEKRSSLPIRLDHVGIFPQDSVVFLAPRRVHALLELHRSIVGEFSLPDDPPIVYENLRLENWVPHCTLAAAPPGGMAMIIGALQENWEPLCGTAEGIGILEPPDTEDRLQLAFSPRASVRPFAAQEWRTYRDLRLAALEDSPEAFGSTLAAEQRSSDEAWSQRLSSGTASESDLPLVAELRGEPVGLAWGRIEPPGSQTAHFYQVWVARDARGMGAGRLLLDAVIEWARAANLRTLVLDVSLGDTPARRLYTRAGFEPAGDPKPLRKGSTLLEQPMRLEL